MKFNKGECVICTNDKQTDLKNYHRYQVERMFDSDYVQINGIKGVFSPNRFIKCQPNSIYVGCKMVCVEAIKYYGTTIIDVGVEVTVISYDGVNISVEQLKDWYVNKNNFELVLDQNPKNNKITILSDCDYISVKDMRNALSMIPSDSDGRFVKGHDSDDETTVWVYTDKPTNTNSNLKIGDLVNHNESNRNGVVYLVEPERIRVRYWDGGNSDYPIDGSNFKVMRND